MLNTSAAVWNSLNDLHDLWLADRATNVGKVPVVEIDEIACELIAYCASC